MATSSVFLHDQLQNAFGDTLLNSRLAYGEVTLTIDKGDLLAVCQRLRDEFGFEQLIDLCGVDYLTYAKAEWDTEASGSGFSRGVEQDIFAFDQTLPNAAHELQDEQRFNVVYHLLSIQHNQRVRLHTTASGMPPRVDSVVTIWNAANWYEREAFDLFGILFEGHPDLRRILTDYGFIGHPFRKDFPLMGEVEMRYDPEQQRVVYQPVSIESRTLVPRVIRKDNRYLSEATD